MISINPDMGTMHRNHCPHCLWSKHVDTKPGNRQSTCHASMEPIGFTFRHDGYDKYGRQRIGDIMIVHHCKGYGEININRIAADDNVYQIGDIYRRSFELDTQLRELLLRNNINLIGRDEEEILRTSLFGKNSNQRF